MKDFLVLLAHLLTTIAKLLGPVGAKAIAAENALMRQQLVVIHGSQRGAPNLTTLDRILFGFWSLFLSPRRIRRAAVVIRPSTLRRFHEALRRQKYRLLFSPRGKQSRAQRGPRKTSWRPSSR